MPCIASAFPLSCRSTSDIARIMVRVGEASPLVNPKPLVRDVASIVYAFGAEGRQVMLFGEDVRVKVGDPQLALLRHAEVAKCIADIGAHHRPEEFRIRGP